MICQKNIYAKDVGLGTKYSRLRMSATHVAAKASKNVETVIIIMAYLQTVEKG
jgi:hypothetical protein